MERKHELELGASGLGPRAHNVVISYDDIVADKVEIADFFDQFAAISETRIRERAFDQADKLFIRIPPPRMELVLFDLVDGVQYRKRTSGKSGEEMRVARGGRRIFVFGGFDFGCKDGTVFELVVRRLVKNAAKKRRRYDYVFRELAQVVDLSFGAKIFYVVFHG
ncbi:MAG: hypothetical protein FWD15_02050 [Alphaproteobacteria bacterium]|nr:hypothetical protein [Alphaproteobacteria bacterium]